MSGARRDFRYDRKEQVWEGRCPSCAASNQSGAWWPLTTEFWDPSSGLQKCRACYNLGKRMRRHQSIEERRAQTRAYYHAHRDERLAWRRAYRAVHKDRINADRRSRYAAKKASQGQTLWEVADAPQDT